jgi:hypothetical protein
MTPERYIARLQALLAAGRYQEALDLSVSARDRLRPALNRSQLQCVHGMMEVAATNLDLQAVEPGPGPHQGTDEPITAQRA